jgi:vancomycin aglycone glucosyltransferase
MTDKKSITDRARDSEMRVLLSTYGSRGDVGPIVGLAVRSRALGAEVRVCAPPDFAELLARVGVPLMPAGIMPTGVWL